MDLTDTIDHNISLTDTALTWLSSYPRGRTEYVSTKTDIHRVTCGVPQGSVLGPILFNLTLPLGNVISRHRILFHRYADDTHLYLKMNPTPFCSHAAVHFVHLPGGDRGVDEAKMSYS